MLWDCEIRKDSYENDWCTHLLILSYLGEKETKRPVLFNRWIEVEVLKSEPLLWLPSSKVGENPSVKFIEHLR